MRISPAIEKVLEVLQCGAETTIGLLDAMTSGYSESYKKLKRYQREPFSFSARGGSASGGKSDWSKSYSESQKFYSLVYYLKKQGLIESKKDGRGSLWRIRPAGVEKLSNIKKGKIFSASSINYREEPDTLKIVAFDIPAKENNKRFWLRAVLKRIGFKMLQKSVWFGKKKIPESFMNDLRERGMIDYVHVLAVSKTGSLRELS